MSYIEAKAAMRDLGNKAQAVVDDSTLSLSEKKLRLENLEADLKTYSDEIGVHEAAKRLMTGGEAAPEAAAPSEVGTKSLGRQIVESDAFRAAAESKGGRFSRTVEMKAATIDEGTSLSNGLLGGLGGTLALPNYLPGIVDLRYAPVTVGSLFSQGTTDSPIVSYVKQSAETIGAAATAEKGAKPQADFTLARVNEQVGKIAVVAKLTDEMLQDAAQVETFLTNRLIGQVIREEENEVLNGTGYPALNGVLGRSGLATSISAGTTGTLADPSKLVDAIFKQVTAIRTTAFVEPDAIVINPTDWQYIRLARDANGQYYAGGPFTGAYGNPQPSNVDMLWGLKVVTSPRIASGTVLVGGFAEGGQLFKRQGITVEMTNSNEDDFKNNLIAVRAETRSALAVYRPGAFGKVTITWA